MKQRLRVTIEGLGARPASFETDALVLTATTEHGGGDAQTWLFGDHGDIDWLLCRLVAGMHKALAQATGDPVDAANAVSGQWQAALLAGLAMALAHPEATTMAHGAVEVRK